jgi:ankyrin repeat protein
MADLFIVRMRLKASLWFAGAVLVGCLFGTWDAWSRIGPGGEGEARFLLFVTVSGALVLALVGLLVVFLTIGKILEPRYGQVERWWDRVPWWLVRVILLLILIGGGTVALLQLSEKMADGFTLLRKGRVAELSDYIDANPSALVQQDKKTGKTLLESALALGNAEVVEMLLTHGVELASASNRNWVVEMLDNPPMLKILLQYGSDPNTPDALDLVPVYYAAKAQNTNTLISLLEAGADVDARNTSSQTPLQLAILADDLSAAKILLEQGADPNEVDRSGDTALHKAVRRRNAEAVRYLLENGADPKIFNFSDMAPIHIAASNGQKGLVKIFLEQSGQLELCGKSNRTAFDHSLRRHKYDTARLLLEKGADINRVMEDGYTAIHLMLIARDYEVVKFLIEEGADVRIANDAGETPLFFMRKKKMEFLLDLVNERDNPEVDEASAPDEDASETNAVESVASP